MPDPKYTEDVLQKNRIDFTDQGFIDDAVVYGHMTRVEQMDDEHVWMCIYDAEGSRARTVFQVYIRNGKLVVQQTEGVPHVE